MSQLDGYVAAQCADKAARARGCQVQVREGIALRGGLDVVEPLASWLVPQRFELIGNAGFTYRRNVIGGLRPPPLTRILGFQRPTDPLLAAAGYV